MKNAYKQGEIVFIRFPFTNFTDFKVRPALVLRDQEDEDITILPISTTIRPTPYDFRLKKDHYKDDPLPVASVVRVSKICTIESALAIKKFSELKPVAFKQVQSALFHFLGA